MSKQSVKISWKSLTFSQAIASRHNPFPQLKKKLYILTWKLILAARFSNPHRPEILAQWSLF